MDEGPFACSRAHRNYAPGAVFLRRMRDRRRLTAASITAVAAALALAPTGAQAAQPGRNGKLAVFSHVEDPDRMGGEFQGIELVGPDGRGGRLLCECSGEFDLSFSPNGRSLAFDGVSVIKVDRSPAKSRKTGLGEYNLSVAWSPNGRRLLYSDLDGGDPPWALFTGNPDGSGVRQITRGANDQVGDWSSRGLIVFSRARRKGADTFSDLYLVRPDGTHLRRLVKDGGGADFAPKGKRIVFQRGSVIYTVGIDGKKLRRVARGDEPVWSPNGRRIAFMRNRLLWTMDRNGRRPRVVLRPTTGFLYGPAWQPLR